MRIPLIYALHSGNLYGTERMALATAEVLAEDFSPVIMAPPGPALEHAKLMGLETCPFRSSIEFASAVRPLLSRSRDAVFLATGVMHSLAAIAGISRCATRHLAHLRDQSMEAPMKAAQLRQKAAPEPRLCQAGCRLQFRQKPAGRQWRFRTER